MEAYVFSAKKKKRKTNSIKKEKKYVKKKFNIVKIKDGLNS